MKHSARKNTVGHETLGAPVGTNTLLIFFMPESNTKCIACRNFQSVCRLPGQTKLYFPFQAVLCMCVEVTSMIVTHQMMSLVDKQPDYYKMNVCKLGE